MKDNVKRKIRKGVAVFLCLVMTSFALAGCGGTDTKTESSSEDSVTTASKNNTKLKSGSWTGKIGDQKVTIKSAYIVDGIDATIDGGTYKSAKKNETVFLVVNGGSLTIKDATVKKSGDEKKSGNKDNSKSKDSNDIKKDSANNNQKQGEQSSQGQPPQGDPPKGNPPKGEKPDGQPPKDAPKGDPPKGEKPDGQPPQGGPQGNDEDKYNFYGLNSAIVCIGKDSSVKIDNCKISTDADGANAVFSTDGANITAESITIKTKQNSSRGLYSTYGGTITASKVDIDTKGAHCAPLATDRGGGTVKVTGTDNKLTAHGEGSPCIYSTGDIQVEGAEGSSDVSETMVIEGKNSITLKDSNLTSKGGNGVMLYQSMSGDAADKDASSKVSTLKVENSTIEYKGDGNVFYVTNTNTNVTLKNSKINYKGSKLINAAAGRWGNEGKNGGTLNMTADGQSLKGNIAADDISKITVKLTNKSTFDGKTSGSVTVDKDDSSKMNKK